MNTNAAEQYKQAWKAGQRYYRNAVEHGAYPYPPALDDLLGGAIPAGYRELGLVDIPAGLITGTKTAGRVSALAGNFMPLLGPETEFAGKWMSLCAAQLDGEGIRDPIQCFEYLGRFYVQEGNKRASVLRSLNAPVIPGAVTRVIPPWSEDPAIQVYYEFMDFYALSRLYGLEFRRRGCYARLQAAMGFAPDHVWTEEERRAFIAGWTRFREVFATLKRGGATVSEALLIWLEVYAFSDLRTVTAAELAKELQTIWADIEALPEPEPITLRTAPDGAQKGLFSRLIGSITPPARVRAAFIYAFDPAESVWTRGHELGRRYIEKRFGDRVEAKAVCALDHDYLRAMREAVDGGAALLFATTPAMIADCRRIAARCAGEVKVLDCALAQPYRGVRTYYSRIYESKYISGAIAGAMAENETIGYVANYPIVGLPASVNAFALGVRLTNPRARVKLVWSCTPGDPLQELLDSGITILSNRDASDPRHAHWALEWGVYRLRDRGALQPLAAPCWNWGRLYEHILLSILSGTWNDAPGGRAINYWWGMDSGVIDVHLNETLPDGVRTLAWILKNGIIGGSVTPFQSRIVDQSGALRNDGSRPLTPEEIMAMDWFCDTVDGTFPAYETLSPRSRETVRMLGLHREELPPEPAEAEKEKP